jgi:PEP-CTERM motif-containing protein
LKNLSVVFVAVHALGWASTALAGEPVLVAVPEPGTLALIGTGVVALAGGAWWRNRK